MQKPEKRSLFALLIVGVLVVLAFGGGVQYSRYRQDREHSVAGLLAVMDVEDVPAPQSEPPAEPEPQPKEAEVEPLLAVHVKGAVENPGLYELPPGSRMADALDMAVLLPEANTDIINLASMIIDGTEVIAPFRLEGEKTDWEALAINASGSASSAESPAFTGTANVTAAATSIININTAGLAALQTLSGVGPVKAQAIIDYREQHGPFAKTDDIKKVSGIGQATYDKIKDRLTVD
ncbi:MAG: helix-hairpin-helix domain-containing protein [Clostridiales bacterium]|nr:helix-hairpin-helix domain-containing protein [Clostridiales bacterium]